MAAQMPDAAVLGAALTALHTSGSPIDDTVGGGAAHVAMPVLHRTLDASMVKPGHRPLHTQVTVLLEERDVLLRELQQHQRGAETIAAELTAGLRLERDTLIARLQASEGSRRSLAEKVARLHDEAQRAEALALEQTAAVDEAQREAKALSWRLEQSEALHQQGNSDAAQLRRVAIDERRLQRRCAADVAAMRQEITSTNLELQRMVSESEGVHYDKEALGDRLSRLLEERLELKKSLASMRVEQERISSEVGAERILSEGLRYKLDEVLSRNEKLKQEHAERLAAQEVAASKRIAELEAACMSGERRHDAAYAVALGERTSWRTLALDEQEQVRTSAERLDMLRQFLEKGASILLNGAQITREMKSSHAAEQREALIIKTLLAMGKLGVVSDAQRPDAALEAAPPLLKPFLTAAISFSQASLALARSCDA